MDDQYKERGEKNDLNPIKDGMVELDGARRPFSTNTKSNSGPISDPGKNSKGQYEDHDNSDDADVNK